MSGGSGSGSDSVNPITPAIWSGNSSWPPVDQFITPGQMPNNYGSFYNSANTTPFGLNTQPGAPSNTQSYYNTLPNPAGLGVPYSYGNGMPTQPSGLAQLFTTPGANNFNYGTQGGLIEQWQPTTQNAFGQQMYANAGPLPPIPQSPAMTNQPSQTFAQFMQQYAGSPAEQVALQQDSPSGWAHGAYDPLGYLSPQYDQATNSLGGNLQSMLSGANWGNAASGMAAPPPPAGTAGWTDQTGFSNGIATNNWWNTDPMGNMWNVGPGGNAAYWGASGDPNELASVAAQSAGRGAAMAALPYAMGNPATDLTYDPTTGGYGFPTTVAGVWDPGYSYTGSLSGPDRQIVPAGTPGASVMPAQGSSAYSTLAGVNVAGKGGDPTFGANGQTIDPALLYRARLRAGVQDILPTYANSVQMPSGLPPPNTYLSAYGLPGVQG